MSSNSATLPQTTAGPDVSGPAAVSRRRFGLEWLSVAPFILFALLFLAAPTVSLVIQAFTDRAGNFTLDNMLGLASDQIVRAYTISIQVSAASALLGAICGLLIALALIRGRLPQGLRAAVMTFSGVASNFAGVPLAFAFIATLGRLGLVTILLREVFHFDMYRAGFNLFSFWGLTLTYLYFQIPLMVVIIAPAVDGLKREWSEAAQTLGASSWDFWRHVGLPILWPPFLGTLSLLFANAFGAIATAWALTGSNLNIVTVLLYNQIRGDALQNPGLGAALAVGMVLITSVANIIYLVVAKRAERWMK
jgi:putative spermidine/putrescine transport system permease protein